MGSVTLLKGLSCPVIFSVHGYNEKFYHLTSSPLRLSHFYGLLPHLQRHSNLFAVENFVRENKWTILVAWYHKFQLLLQTLIYHTQLPWWNAIAKIYF